MSALEEYNDWNLHDFLHNMTEQEKGDRKWVPLDVADAMRDELLARIEELSKENRQQRIDWMERMNAIELERKGDEATNHALMRAKFNSYNELRKRADDAEQELAEAKAEVERLNNALMDKDDDYWRPKLRLLQDDRAKAEAALASMKKNWKEDRAKLAAAEERVRELEWCANELMRHGMDYQRRRAGYADFWSLIWQDVLDAYDHHHAAPREEE